MSRSVYGAVCIEPFGDVLEKTIKILTKNGFTEIADNYEYIWYRENAETKFVTCIKTECMTNVFAFSVWLKDMKDEFQREVCVEAFQQCSREVKDAENIIESLLGIVEGKFKKAECYIYE